MSLVKTEKGRDALQRRDAALSARDRQILILANGIRSRAELVGLMGESVSEQIDRLKSLGLVTEVRIGDVAKVSKDRLSMTGTFSPADLAAAAPVPPVPAPRAPANAPASTKPGMVAATAAAPAPNAPSALLAATAGARGRRSLAATKMYCIDMLQLLREMDSSVMAVRLQTSATEEELMANALLAMRYIRERSGDSYGLKVMDRLLEIIPEPFMPALQELMAETRASAL